MNKSWSMSYCYTSDGSNVSEIVHKSHNDGEILLEDGYSRVDGKELKEKFYKIKKDNKGKKTLLGKSKNKEEWELLGDINGKKQKKKEKYVDLSSKFINSQSTKHRLINQNKNNKNLIEYDSQNDLNNMIEKLNIFDDEDFFKL